MSLPKFFPRVNDAISPLLGRGADVRDFLTKKSILIRTPPNLDRHPLHTAGIHLLVNLCARLYPLIRIDSASRLAEDARALAMQINPGCEFHIGPGPADASLSWACPDVEGRSIVVAPHGWEVAVDTPEAATIHETNMPTALAAGAIAAAELFRAIFAEFLPKGRTIASPGCFSLLSHVSDSPIAPELPADIALGRVHLVGAGAVGQALVYTLARVSATGTIVVVDPEDLELSNLQRYVLAMDEDVGTPKCTLVERALRNKIETVTVHEPWTSDLPQTKNAEVICSAVDSEEVRISLQASLPRRIYNAWTQPGDIGWSRHEQFGERPCLACLYWPTRPRPGYHELVARAVRQHELRVLAYLVHKIPVDLPLQDAQIPRIAEYKIPPEASDWPRRSLLEDIAVQLRAAPEDLKAWRGRLLPDLYREGICGGALVQSQAAEVPVEMAVPLAHQSVLAGIMLATQLLLAARKELNAYRSTAVEWRLDLLAGLPQVVERPRHRTQNCLCADPDFVDHYRKRWPYAARPT